MPVWKRLLFAHQIKNLWIRLSMLVSVVRRFSSNYYSHNHQIPPMCSIQNDVGRITRNLHVRVRYLVIVASGGHLEIRRGWLWSQFILRCSDEAVWIFANFSRPSQIKMHYGNEWIHLVNVGLLSVIPWPRVMPLDYLNSLMRSCSMVWSVKFPLLKRSGIWDSFA